MEALLAMEILQVRPMLKIQIKNKKGASEAVKLILAIIIMVIFVVLFWDVMSKMLSVGTHYKAYDTLRNEISEVCSTNADNSRTVNLFLPKALGGPSGSNPCWKQSTSTLQGVGRGKVLSLATGGSGGYLGFCDKTTYISIKMLPQNTIELIGYKSDTKRDEVYKRATIECAEGVEIEPFTLASDINIESHTLQIIKEGNLVWLDEVI